MAKCGRRLDIVKHKSRKRIDIKVDKPDIEQEGKGKVHFPPRQFTLSILLCPLRHQFLTLSIKYQYPPCC